MSTTRSQRTFIGRSKHAFYWLMGERTKLQRRTQLPWPAFIPIFDRVLGRVSKWHARGKSTKKIFCGIYIEIKQLEVGHNVITMKLECHLMWFSTTSTIDYMYRRPQWGRYVRLNSSCTAYVMHLFKKNILKHFSEEAAMENSINLSLLSMFLQKLKSSFSRWLSCYGKWEAPRAKLEKHLKFIL